MARLAGKVAFITGGGTGIGRATAERFAEEGAKVVIADINEAWGEAAAQSARTCGGKSGGDALFVRCDVSDRPSVEAAFAETINRFGKLHILHNNAGGSSPNDGPVTEVTEEEFWRTMRLDVFGTFLCSKIGIRISSNPAAARSSTCRRSWRCARCRGATAIPRRKAPSPR